MEMQGALTAMRLEIEQLKLSATAAPAQPAGQTAAPVLDPWATTRAAAAAGESHTRHHLTVFLQLSLFLLFRIAFPFSRPPAAPPALLKEGGHGGSRWRPWRAPAVP